MLLCSRAYTAGEGWDAHNPGLLELPDASSVPKKKSK